VSVQAELLGVDLIEEENGLRFDALQIVNAYLLTSMCSWCSLKLSLHVDQFLVKFAQQSLQTKDENTDCILSLWKPSQVVMFGPDQMRYVYSCRHD
jgi:hypothetical protein